MITKALVVQTTFTDRREAEEFAVKILNSRLAACVQLSADVTSFFWWNGTIEQEKEIVVTMKTRADVYPQLESLISDLHSYETPEVVAMPIIHGSKNYVSWLEEEVDGQKR